MYSVVSDLEIGGFTYTWKIDNFSCAEKMYDLLSGPVASVQIFGGTQWLLQLYFGKRFRSCMFLILKRGVNDTGPNRLYIDLEMFIKKNDGSLHSFRQMKNHFNKKDVLFLQLNKERIFGKSESLLKVDTIIFGCRITVSDLNPLWLEYNACSNIEVKKCDFRFPVHLPIGMGHHSSSIVPIYSSIPKFPNIEIMFVATSVDGNSAVEVSINMMNTKENIFAMCNMSLEDFEGNQKYHFQGYHWFFPNIDHQTWFLRHIMISELFLEKVTDPSLMMLLKLTVSTAIETTLIKSVSCSPDCSSPEFASHYLQNLSIARCTSYTDREFSDLTLCVDGYEFHVHKAILSSVSPVFSAVFHNDTEEENGSFLSLKEADMDTVNMMLQFIYTKTCDINWNRALALYKTADTYQISCLKKYCFKFLLLNLDNENIWDILKFQCLRENRYMRNAFHNIIRERWRVIFRSDEWVLVMKNYPKFSCEIMFHFMSNLETLES